MAGIDALGTLHTISSGDWRAYVDSRGAKVLALIHGKRNLLHYDPADIAHSGIPLCLPQFGPISPSVPLPGGAIHPLPQHGFFRDSEFTVRRRSPASLICTLQDNEATRALYPYSFHAEITIALDTAGLSLAIQVQNTGTALLPVAPGIHPYFAVTEPENLQFATCATEAEDYISGGTLIRLEESSELELVARREDGVALFTVQGAPDLHLLNHGLPTTPLRTGKGESIRITADPELFDRLTLWRRNPDSPYLCVEPSSARNRLLTHPLLVPPGMGLRTTLRIGEG